MSKNDILKLLNKALELEHAARIQYLSHAETISGLNAEPIISRLKEIAGDEQKHEEKFRRLIGDFLEGVPSMGIAKTKSGTTIRQILGINLKDEKDAVDFYTEILKKVNDAKKEFPYEFLTLEHEIRHVIIDEQEHIAELKLLLANDKSG